MPATPPPPQFKDEVRIVFMTTVYEKMRMFYERTLGLRVLDEWDAPEEHNRGVVYDLNGTQLEILEATDAPVILGSYTYIEVADVNELWERLSSTVQIAEPIADRPWKHRNFSIKDPGGFTLKFFSKLP
ncbi:MAG TPA: VOC family protein [Candidatus Peribacteria bacterium]|nr:VOC family protein [Candidatus Peribacteria bacterium]